MINILLGGALGVVVWLIVCGCATRVYRVELAKPDWDDDVCEACEQICSPVACACWVAVGALIGVLTL